MFVCLDPCTWQEREYDNHTTPLSQINPAQLDTGQWCRAARLWGAKEILFVAKHTGGFCWWQTETTKYGIKETPWKEGKGDVLADLSASCREQGLRLGIYISPVDDVWGAPSGSGGRTKEPSKQEAYNRVFRQQLTEVLTRYGTISEVWFDGSCVIDVSDLLRQHASNAVIFQGPQATIRWAGTESGKLPYPAWNSLKSQDLRTGVATAAQGDPDGDAWAPLEADTTLYNHNWFWAAENEKKRKSLDELLDIYYQSAGRGGVLLLNSSPNTNGLIPEDDLKLYETSGQEIERRFSRPIAEIKDQRGGCVELSLPRSTMIDHIVLMENYREGERIREYILEGFRDGEWKLLQQGTSVCRKKIDRFPPTQVSRVRVRVTRSGAEPLIRSLAAFQVEGASTNASPAMDSKALTDKTLVAWVYLANTNQQGGSAVTLIDKAEHFDAIVLGEISPARWMGGSDFFRRTHRDQNAWPVESASSNTLVQVAIAYLGDQVTLFRNGQQSAAYSISQPQAFGGDAMVLLGLRYLGGMGEIGFFTGALEDVRIYDLALNADQIRALSPHRRSEPKPLAWWTFEGGKAEDLMGTFRASRLEGSARIVDDKLVLDGGGYLWAAKDPKLLVAETEEEPAFDNGIQTLFYKARSRRTGNMWDTWLYLHEGTFYLYYLANARGQWDNISMATSPDGVHWREIGRVLAKGRGVTWMGTGSTWKSPHFEQDRKFLMNFSEWKGPRQTIFFAESQDLVHWTRLGNEHEFVQDEHWYERNGRWDCIWVIPRPGGGLYGYWTATPKAETGGRFGFGETLDGITWKALAPPKVTGVGEGEAGAIEKIGDRYYMMFGTGGVMVTLVADHPEGPFVAASANFRLLTGHTYFARFFPTPEGVLVNHHSIARDGQVYFGTLKATRLDASGTLRLSWWPGNEKFKHQAIPVKAPTMSAGPAPTVTMIETEFDPQRGLVLEGTLQVPADREASPIGLFLAQADNSGTGILVQAGGVTELGPMKADGTGFKAEQHVDREWAFGRKARFRLLLKGSLVEFYLDDLLMQCYSLPQMSTGRIGLIQSGQNRAIDDLKAWQCAAVSATSTKR